jgi:hypothetical protein
MQRRNRPVRRKSSPLRWLGWLAGLLFVSAGVLMFVAPSLITNFIRSYVQKEEFRQKAEEMIGAKTGGEARLSPLLWSDETVTVSELTVNHAGGWDIEATALQATLDFGAIRKRLWHVQSAGAEEITLRRQNIAAGGGASGAFPKTEETEEAASAIPAFLRRYIPDTTEIDGFDVQRFFFEQAGWKIIESRLRLSDWKSGETSVAAKITGGALQTPLRALEQKEPLKLDITQGSLRIGADQLQLSNATLRWKQQAEATLRGQVMFKDGSWQTFARVKAVPMDEFLNDWWDQRLTGQVEGDLECSGSRNQPLRWKAEVALKNGVLQGLPLLEKLVTYTKIHRFNRVVLDICSASFRPQDDALRVEKIVVQSSGLLRIEGSMTVRGRAIEGDFMVGVTPEALVAIPGANNRVFVEGNPGGAPGLQWTRVRIAGTLDAPQEDLSSRLIGAAGMSLLLDTPEKLVNQGAETLLKPVLGEDAAKMPGKLIEGATGVIENGVKAGTGIINKVLPVFPGK